MTVDSNRNANISDMYYPREYMFHWEDDNEFLLNKIAFLTHTAIVSRLNIAHPGRAWTVCGPTKRPIFCWWNVQMQSIWR